MGVTLAPRQGTARSDKLRADMDALTIDAASARERIRHGEPVLNAREREEMAVRAINARAEEWKALECHAPRAAIGVADLLEMSSATDAVN